MFKKLLVIIASVILLSACKSGNTETMPGDLYPPEYTVAECMPYNVEVNKRAFYQLIDSFAEFRTMSISYPEYGAEGRLSVVMVDSARLIPALDRYLALMETKSDTIREIDERRVAGGITRWVFTHPHGQEQLQWMATDSMTMYVAGNIRFVSASDSLIDITPALENIRMDIIHLVDNLKMPSER